MKKNVRLLLGDQLNAAHSWFEKTDDSVIYCFFEMRQETDYAWHHIQKVIGFFLAMRAYRKELISRSRLAECLVTTENDTALRLLRYVASVTDLSADGSEAVPPAP